MSHSVLKRHSRTYTTLKGMDRIARHRASRASKSSERTPSTRGPGARDDGTLRLLLVGADRTEGTCPRDTAAVFDGLLADAGKTNASESSSSSSSSSPPPLFRRAMEGVRRVDVVLVGPNVRLDDGVERDVFHAVSRRRDDADDDDAKETTTTTTTRSRSGSPTASGCTTTSGNKTGSGGATATEPTKPPTTTTRLATSAGMTRTTRKKRGTGTVGRRTRRR